MNKFKFLIKHGLAKRLLKKSFIITNIVLGLVIVVLVNIPSLIDIFSGDEELEQTHVMVANKTQDEAYPLEETLLSKFNQVHEENRYVAYEHSLEAFEDFWDTENLDILLVFSGDLNAPDVDVYLRDEGLRNHVLSNIQIFLNEYQGIQYANYTFVEAPDPGDTPGMDPETRMFIEGILSMLFLPMFILIIMTTQFLGVDIIEEKSTKAIETIVSSVPAKVHLLSKIVTNLAFLIVQSTIFIAFGVVGILVSRAITTTTDTEALSLLAELAARIPNWPSMLLIMLAYMFVGTLLYLCLAGLIASMATSQEDYQQFQAPLIFMLLGSFYIAIFLPIAGLDGGIRIAAYIPFFSTMVAPVAYATGIMGVWETLLTLFITGAVTVLFLYYITPIYKVAILSYEETKFFKRIKFYVKKAFANNNHHKNNHRNKRKH